ncbi:hypothetical protein N658DRAFT_123067 [Parathielavia hyrcaniae]|uniref:Uncharacterized protein n=1 Tax=Parathielavia hyrcaniae TaxID=113614 RepID=A0AAN6Q8I1_9PEZI|nr:hypothetical protein N658DRAFT_123067 [Parathielavia hyrcaniae]
MLTTGRSSAKAFESKRQCHFRLSKMIPQEAALPSLVYIQSMPLFIPPSARTYPLQTGLPGISPLQTSKLPPSPLDVFPSPLLPHPLLVYGIPLKAVLHPLLPLLPLCLLPCPIAAGGISALLLQVSSAPPTSNTRSRAALTLRASFSARCLALAILLSEPDHLAAAASDLVV